MGPAIPRGLRRPTFGEIDIMGSMSLVHWAIVGGIIVLLFGSGRLSNVMGEFARGIKAFKSGMREDEPGRIDAAARPLPPDASARH
jgi:sec-independent protein translocase protein TatA